MSVKNMRNTLHRIIVIAVVCVFLSESPTFVGSTSALAPSPGTQDPVIRREAELLSRLLSDRLIFAKTDEDEAFLKRNNADALLLSHGKILVSGELKKDPLKLMRRIIHEQIEAIMQIIECEDPAAYADLMNMILTQKAVSSKTGEIKEIKDIFIELFPEAIEDSNLPLKDLSPRLLANHIIAKAFELLIPKRNNLIKIDELSDPEREFLKVMEPIIKAHQHSYFDGSFRNLDVMEYRIRVAMANGMSFQQAANNLTATPPHPSSDTASVISGRLKQPDVITQPNIFKGISQTPRRIDPRIWYEGKKMVVYQTPLFSAVPDGCYNYGIGKITYLPELAIQKSRDLGVNAMMFMPIHPVIDEERSPYSFVCGFAINELNIDWHMIAKAHFRELLQNEAFMKNLVPKETGYIDYDDVERREAKLARAVFEAFKANRGKMEAEFNSFKDKFWWWVNDYAEFRVLRTEFGNKKWWEWCWDKNKIDKIKAAEQYEDSVEFYRFMQYVALKQWLEAIEELHEIGMAVLYDQPWFCSKDSVEVWKNSRYFQDMTDDKSPGVNTPTGVQKWFCFARYKYIELGERGYDLILNQHEYKMDVMQFDGGRIDAAHMAYLWVPDWDKHDLQSGDEPGNEFKEGNPLLEAIKNVFDERRALCVAENLGAHSWVADKIKDEIGLRTMVVLKWLEEDTGGKMAFLNTHDHPRLRNFCKEDFDPNDPEGSYKGLFTSLFHCGAEMVCIIAGEEYGDDNIINNPELSKEERKIYCWRYLLPHQNSGRRRFKGLDGHIKWLADRFTESNWKDENTKNWIGWGRMAARETELDNFSEATLEDIQKEASFTPRYDFKNRFFLLDPPEIKARKAAIFGDIIRVIDNDRTEGIDSLRYHAVNGDWFNFARYILSTISGFRKDEAPEIWEYINHLQAMSKKQFNKGPQNLVLLGFMAELLERIDGEARQRVEAIACGKKAAGKIRLDNISETTLNDIQEEVSFTPRYDYGRRPLLPNGSAISAKKADIFEEIIRTINASGRAGTYSLRHHAAMGDWFKFARYVLNATGGLRESEAPEVWKYIDNLEDSSRKEFHNWPENLELLNFMTELMKRVDTKIRTAIAHRIEISSSEDDLPEEAFFTASMKDLEEASWVRFAESAETLNAKARSLEKGARSLILYSDDILKHVAVVDLENTMKILSKYNVLGGGRVILYAKDETNAVILERIIKRAAPELRTIKMMEDDQNIHRDEADVIDTILRQERSKGINDLLGIVRGGMKKPEELKELTSSYNLPIVIIGSEGKGIYSFAQAVKAMINAKAEDIKGGRLILLVPIKVFTEEIRAKYDNYQRSLQALVA